MAGLRGAFFIRHESSRQRRTASGNDGLHGVATVAGDMPANVIVKDLRGVAACSALSIVFCKELRAVEKAVGLHEE